MRLNVSRASSSLIRMMRVRLKVRAAALSKKCCDMGSIHVGGSIPFVTVEIERQLDYVR
jgi:hypothetical protein